MPRTSTRMRGCALHEIEAARLRGCKRDLPGAARYRAWKCWMSSARLPARKRARRIEHQTRVGSCTHLSGAGRRRSEEHTSEFQSLMRISYAVFCLTKTHTQHTQTTPPTSPTPT